ncbi:MAG TPA: ATP-binding protein [Flavobacteriaceae bacterium]|nr:ATP-binding protein [Flavobacteriaceae bacterium]
MEKTLEQQAADCLKIVIFGPESTGKTSLAKSLAEYYHTEWVPEYAREYLQEKYDNVGEICAPEDLMPIAEGQMKAENKLAQKADKVLFCDTNLLETYVYGQAYYRNFKNDILKTAAENSRYDLYFLTYIDVPWEADDLRDKPAEREEMFERFENALKLRNLPYISLKGTLSERMKTAVKTVDGLLKSRNIHNDN